MIDKENNIYIYRTLTKLKRMNMKRITFLLLCVVGLLFSSQVKAANYHVDETSVDQLIETTVETVDMGSMAMSNATAMSSDREAVVAIVLDCFLGGLGIHRLYLGTEIISWILYPITAGGIFGIVPIIDLIVLIIDYDDISAYINNPSFFMWKDSF